MTHTFEENERAEDRFNCECISAILFFHTSLKIEKRRIVVDLYNNQVTKPISIALALKSQGHPLITFVKYSENMQQTFFFLGGGGNFFEKIIVLQLQ